MLEVQKGTFKAYIHFSTEGVLFVCFRIPLRDNRDRQFAWRAFSETSNGVVCLGE